MQYWANPAFNPGSLTFVASGSSADPNGADNTVFVKVATDMADNNAEYMDPALNFHDMSWRSAVITLNANYLNDSLPVAASDAVRNQYVKYIGAHTAGHTLGIDDDLAPDGESVMNTILNDEISNGQDLGLGYIDTTSLRTCDKDIGSSQYLGVSGTNYTFVRNAYINSASQCTFSTNTAGNLIVVNMLVTGLATIPSTITDSAGNTYNVVTWNYAEPWLGQSGGYWSYPSMTWAMYYATNITAATNNVITIPPAIADYSGSASGIPIAIEAQEFSSAFSSFTVDAQGNDEIANWWGLPYQSPQTATIDEGNGLYVTFSVTLKVDWDYYLTHDFSNAKSPVTESTATNDVGGAVTVWSEPLEGTLTVNFAPNGAAPDGPIVFVNGAGIYGSTQ